MPMRIGRRALLSATALLGAAGAMLPGVAAAAEDPDPERKITRRVTRRGSRFALGCDGGAITSLRAVGDRFDTDYIEPGAALGHVRLAYRRGAGAWRQFDSSGGSVIKTIVGDTTTCRVDESLDLTLTLALAGEGLDWEIGFHNRGDAPVEIGDLALPLPMHTRFKGGRPQTEAVLKHSFVSGHGSHLFWMRSNSAGPFLVLLPVGDTHLEYWDRKGAYAAYIHSAATGSTGRSWRQPHTSLTLKPGGNHRHTLRFQWAEDYAGVRAAIVAGGGIDVEVVPGMTVPSDLFARFALRSDLPIAGIDAEFPEATTIQPLGLRDGRHLYQVAFRRLGENRLTIRHGRGRTTHLEFFATEPLETLIAKRGAFIAAHQHRDASKWYDGLLAEWNMESRTLLGPDNYDRIKGWRIYEVSCDDPGLSKPAFLAAKNAEHPVQDEVDALDRYVDRFVWGGLQRSTAETHPYGIYGIPDWKTNRGSADPGPKGQLHIWRPYDYPHIVVLYLGLYRIARDHPQIRTRMDAAAYLERARGTALAMFTIPPEVANWSPYETGFYNERVIPEVIDALSDTGRGAEAAELRGHWERKVRTFVSGEVDLFGSEYPFDSTGFESTHAFARYALEHGPAIGIPRDKALAFRDRQMAANLFCRGWLEPAYYTLGSDYRAQGADSYTLSYMAQMGGWAVLDHALTDAPDPLPLVRLGYASYLSSWALVNSGTAESGYGYWYPGIDNDGAAAGGFEPSAESTTWLDQPNHRGAWYYACEIDLGFCGALRSAATLLVDDPIFGRFAYGGTLGDTGVIPRDGVRRRFHARLDAGKVDVTVEGARFAAGRSIRVSADAREVRFRLESDNPAAHEVRLKLDGVYAVSVAGVEQPGATLHLPAGGAEVTLTR